MGDVRLIRGDCVRELLKLPDGCFDAVITDPPYGQTNEKYDGPVAFDPAVWRACYRVCKPNAALLAFAGNPTYHRIAGAIEAAGWKVRQMWAWVYRDGLITSAYPREGFDRLRPALDPIVFATKGRVLLRAERVGSSWDKKTGRDRSRPSFREFGLSERNGGRCKYQASGHRPTCLASDGTAPFEYFVLSRTNGGATENDGHPNQKPLALMEWLIGKLPGGTVLDPFAGSGTTGVAALQAGRNAVLIEKDPEYCKIIRKRLAAARVPEAA